MSDNEKVASLLRELGAAYRGDWGGFDGRVLRDELDFIAALTGASLIDIEACRQRLGLCPRGNGHWESSCGYHNCAP